VTCLQAEPVRQEERRTRQSIEVVCNEAATRFRAVLRNPERTWRSKKTPQLQSAFRRGGGLADARPSRQIVVCLPQSIRLELSQDLVRSFRPASRQVTISATVLSRDVVPVDVSAS
jgi:hypothetical protein